MISTAAFASLDRIVTASAADLCPRLARLAPLGAAAVGGATWIRAGFLPSEIAPARAAARLAMPVMIVHGRDDEFIPYSHAEEIFSRIPSARKVLRPVEGAGHARVLASDSSRLFAEMAGFLIEASRTGF